MKNTSMKNKRKKGAVHRIQRKEKKVKKEVNKKRQRLSKTAEFICPKCGYEAYKMARYSHCPLCIVCTRCRREVRKCTCIEGE